MADEPGLTLTIYTAEPGSPSDERLQLLGSWAATHDGDTTTTLASGLASEDARWRESS